jgi:ketosteroid isomerase-like protein
MRKVLLTCARFLRFLAVTALILTAAAMPAGAQKKNKNKNAPPSDSAADAKSMLPMPDSQAIDQAIGEALGYWQIGDTASLHKYYADDVVLVSGAWEAPIIGWDNFLKAYQAQREHVTGARMDRSNTLIKVNGNSAWATYQFVYAAQSQGQVVQYRGHTTLMLAKQGDKWLITLNHSSIVDSTIPQPSISAGSDPPGKP